MRLAAFTGRLEVWDGEGRVADHDRCYKRGQLILDFRHYLPVLAKKPHAASHAAFVSQMPAIYATVRDELCRSRPDGYREFAAILLLHREFPAEAVAAAVEEAHRCGCLQQAVVRQLLLNGAEAKGPLPVAVPESLAGVKVEAPDLSQYDMLVKGVA